MKTSCVSVNVALSQAGESPDTRQEGWSRAVERLARRQATGMRAGGDGRDRCSRARTSGDWPSGPGHEIARPDRVEEHPDQQVEEARDRTRGCTGIEGERTGGYRTSVRSHHSHVGSNDATRSEQNTGRGLGQQPCALQNRQLYISAPKLALCERDRTYEAAQ